MGLNIYHAASEEATDVEDMNGERERERERERENEKSVDGGNDNK